MQAAGASCCRYACVYTQRLAQAAFCTGVLITHTHPIHPTWPTLPCSKPATQTTSAFALLTKWDVIQTYRSVLLAVHLMSFWFPFVLLLLD